jgi:hypothetical protein
VLGRSKTSEAFSQPTSPFTAPVNVEMRVGALEETINVSGQAPVVDIQNVVHERVVSREQLFTLPINRELGGFAAIIPGAVIAANQQDVGGNKDPISQGMSIHDNRATDNRQLLDGMRFNAEGSGRGFYFNPAAAQEVSVELGGQAAEYELGGVQANLIPKEGRNNFTGFLFADGTNSSLAGDNLTPALQARGLQIVNKQKYIYDTNFALGGPLKKDKLWFFTAHRIFGYANTIAGDFYNATENSLFYTPDKSRQAFIDESNRTHSVRFTWQASPRNKLNFSYDIQDTCLCHVSLTGLLAPEASQIRYYKDPNYLLQGKWNFVASSFRRNRCRPAPSCRLATSHKSPARHAGRTSSLGLAPSMTCSARAGQRSSSIWGGSWPRTFSRNRAPSTRCRRRPTTPLACGTMTTATSLPTAI